MTPRRTIYNFQNVGQGKTAICNLQTGANFRYHWIQIKYQDGNASPVDISTALGDIRVKYNSGKVLRLHSAAQLDTQINGVNGSQYLKSTYSSGNIGQTQTLTIWFAEPWRKSIVQQEQLALNADARNGINSLSVEVDINSSANTTCSLTCIAGHDNTTDPGNTPRAVVFVDRTQFAVAGKSINVPSGQLGGGKAYQAIYLVNPSSIAFISKAVLKYGSETIHEMNQDENAGLLVGYDMNPNKSTTAGAAGYDLVLDVADSVLDALPVANGDSLDLRLEFATIVSNVVTPTAGVGAVVALVQTLDTLS